MVGPTDSQRKPVPIIVCKVLSGSRYDDCSLEKGPVLRVIIAVKLFPDRQRGQKNKQRKTPRSKKSV